MKYMTMDASFGGPAKVFSVSLTANVAARNSAVESQFDRERQPLAILAKKIKTQTTRMWLGRPPVEQVPLLPVTCAPVEPIGMVEMATKVNHCWSGRILWARTIRPPFRRSNALWTLVKEEVEEEKNSSPTAILMPLSLWNYLPLSSNDEYLGKDVEMELPADVCYVALAHPVLVPNRIWDTTEATD